MPVRRDILKFGFTLAANFQPQEHDLCIFPGQQSSLDSLAREKGLRFGSAVGAGQPGTVTGAFSDPACRAILIRECGALVPENELKWQLISAAGPNERDFRRADIIAQFARENGKALRGHTLLWHHPKRLPNWMTTYDFGSGKAGALKASSLLHDHIKTVCQRYPEVFSWDVVNEAIDPQTGAARTTIISDKMGLHDALDLSFYAARQFTLNSRLVYNDFMTWGPESKNHRLGVLKLLESFRYRGTPVDALGIQSHLQYHTFNHLTKRDEIEWHQFLTEVTGLGYDLLITELDIQLNSKDHKIYSENPDMRHILAAYLDMILSFHQTKEVLTWGMVDKYSWLQLPPYTKIGPQYPLPYDGQYRAKPFRNAIATALKSAPRRDG